MQYNRSHKSQHDVTRFESRSFRDSKRTPQAKNITKTRKAQRARKANIRAGRNR